VESYIGIRTSLFIEEKRALSRRKTKQNQNLKRPNLGEELRSIIVKPPVANVSENYQGKEKQPQIQYKKGKVHKGGRT